MLSCSPSARPSSLHIRTQLRSYEPRGAMSCGSPMPRGERIAKPAEQATRLAVFFRAPSRTATEVPMSPRNNPRQVVRSFAIAAGFAALTGCADHASAPTGLSLAASRSGLPFTAGLASPAWQATEASLVAQANLSPVVAVRAYSLVGVAQYLAVQRAEGRDGGGGREQLESDRGAVAGASAVVLTYLFPSQAQALEAMVNVQDRKSTRLNSSHQIISYAVFCLKKKNK